MPIRPPIPLCCVLIGLGAAALPIEAAPPDTPARQPAESRPDAPDPPDDAEPPARGATIDSADDLLEALEQAGREITTLRARIRYTKVFALAGDEQIRIGEFYYVGAPADVSRPVARKLAVHFEHLQLGTGPGARLDREPKRYVFDGQWLVEAMPDEKRMVKRQVVPPGESFDPLRLGEGPFPIPIGQKREEILARFTAEMPPTEQGLDAESLLEHVTREPTHQLALTPRPAYADEIGLERIRIWYRADSLLPVLAWTLKPDGDEAFVQLINVRTNQAIPPEAVSTATPQRGWDVEIRPWRGSLEGDS